MSNRFLKTTLHIIARTAVCSILLIGGTAHAQLGEIEVSGLDPLSIEINPQYPQPGESVTAEAVSNVYDLNGTAISWTVDGKIIAGESGKTTRFTMGPTGSRTSVGVTVRTTDGLVISEKVDVYPGIVDLIWEAPFSYTPPFYKGKALPAPGTTLNLVAIPDIRNASGTKIATSNLMFVWTQNGRALNDASGRGKNTLTVRGPELYGDFEIRLEVTSLDETVGARGYLTLPPAKPLVYFYENHPTLGIRLERALSSEIITSGEIEVSAQPYYFDTHTSGDSDIQYTWSINGAPVTNPSANPSFIILRPTGPGGEAYVGATVRHLTQIFQEASKSFDLQFTGEEQ